MTKKILLTGATGFVGRQVAKALSSADVELTFITRKEGGNPIIDLGVPYRVIETDDLFSEKEEWWKNACSDIDILIHLAWHTTQPNIELTSASNIKCLQGSLELVKGAINAGIRRFVGIGTCFEYDMKMEGVGKGGILSTDTPLKPLTPYADAKAALFMSLSHWLPMRSVEFAWCRLFYLYGEGEDPRRLVGYLRLQMEKSKPAILTNGEQIRDFLDVADAGQIIAKVALSGQNGPVNICSGIPITVRQLSEKIADEYGRRDLLLFGARPDNLVDPPCILGIPGQGKVTDS
jgi:dTDP-6-deoxy-L-talose 4-dehydrogenase (NAD+)